MAAFTPSLSNNTMDTPQNESTMTENASPVREQYWFKLLICSLYGVIFLFGVTGNSIVIFVIHRRKKLKTVTNLFILNLAISDLIFSGSLPLEIPLILGNFAWPYSSSFCKIYSPTQTIAVAVSIFTLTAVSCIRYRAIILPLRSQISHSVAKYILIGIWIFATMLMIPHYITLRKKENHCSETWPKVFYRKTYTTVLFACLFVIPLVIIVFAYSKIVRELRRKKSYQNASLDKTRAEESKKVIHMLIKVTILFTVCNLPSQIMWLWLDFGNADKIIVFFLDLLMAMNVLIFANSAANPLLYYLYHDKFRDEICGYLRRLRRMAGRLKMGNRHKHDFQFTQRLHYAQDSGLESTNEVERSPRHQTSVSDSNRIISCETSDTRAEYCSQV